MKFTSLLGPVYWQYRNKYSNLAETFMLYIQQHLLVIINFYAPHLKLCIVSVSFKVMRCSSGDVEAMWNPQQNVSIIIFCCRVMVQCDSSSAGKGTSSGPSVSVSIQDVIAVLRTYLMRSTCKPSEHVSYIIHIMNFKCLWDIKIIHIIIILYETYTHIFK